MFTHNFWLDKSKCLLQSEIVEQCSAESFKPSKLKLLTDYTNKFQLVNSLPNDNIFD